MPLFFLRRCNEMFFLDYTLVESFNSSVLNHVFTFHINKKRKLNQVITCVKTLWEVRVDLENCAHFWKISSYAPVNLSNHTISDKIATVSSVVSLHNEYSKTSLHREKAMLKIWADRSLLWEQTRLIKLRDPDPCNRTSGKLTRISLSDSLRPFSRRTCSDKGLQRFKHPSVFTHYFETKTFLIGPVSNYISRN